MKMTMQNNILIESFVFVFFMAGAMSAFGQQGDASIKSEIRDKAYNAISKGYDTYATVNDEETLYAFLRLFVDEEVSVYNDLLGLSPKRTLPVGEYARILADGQITTKRIHIKNLQIEYDPVKTDAGWTVVVSFDKEMSYYNGCKVYFSSREFYDADYHLTATLLYDEVDGQCRISRIDGTVASSNILPTDYVVLQQTSNRDLQLSYHQQPLSFNSSQQAILSGFFDSHGFTHPKIDANRLSPRIDNCNIVTMDYLSPSSVWRIKPHFGFGLGNALDIEGDSIMSSTSSSSLNYGVDFGFKFLEAGPLKFSAFVGLGVTKSSMELGYSDSLYMTTAGADADGQQYKRYYSNLKLNQTVKFTDLSIPVYLDAEVGIGSVFSAYADFGFRFNFNMSSKVTETSGSSDAIYGIYPTPLGIYFGDLWPFNGFVKACDFGEAQTEQPAGVKSMSIDMMGGMGFRCAIPSTPFSIDLGANFLMGLGEMMKPEKVEDGPAIVHNVLSEDKLTSSEQVNLHGQIEKLKRKSLQFNIGLIYKF